MLLLLALLAGCGSVTPRHSHGTISGLRVCTCCPIDSPPPTGPIPEGEEAEPLRSSLDDCGCNMPPGTACLVNHQHQNELINAPTRMHSICQFGRHMGPSCSDRVTHLRRMEREIEERSVDDRTSTEAMINSATVSANPARLPTSEKQSLTALPGVVGDAIPDTFSMPWPRELGGDAVDAWLEAEINKILWPLNSPSSPADALKRKPWRTPREILEESKPGQYSEPELIPESRSDEYPSERHPQQRNERFGFMARFLLEAIVYALVGVIVVRSVEFAWDRLRSSN